MCYQNVHDLDYDLENSSRSSVNIPIDSKEMTCYLMAIVIFAIANTISQIFTFKIMRDLDLDL